MSVYLDHNATTTIRASALDAVRAALVETGNASSVHQAGRQARARVEQARNEVAMLAGAQDAKGVIFTSGATEANNTVIQHFAGQRIFTSSVEHPSVREADASAERIPVTRDGTVDLDAFAAMMDGGDAPALVSVIMAGNETGVIQPVAEIAAIAKAKGALVHTDAVQAAGRIPLDMVALGVDYLTLSAHKMGGPQGVGALVCAPKAPPVKLLYGGGQERRQRAGTENVAGIAGFGAAAKEARETIDAFQTLATLRDDMEKRFVQSLSGITIHGANAPRTANTSCFSLAGVPADTQLMALDLAGYCVSSGSACSSGSVQPSKILGAMGVDDDLASNALRISFGWPTTRADVEGFIGTYIDLAKKWVAA